MGSTCAKPVGTAAALFFKMFFCVSGRTTPQTKIYGELWESVESERSDFHWGGPRGSKPPLVFSFICVFSFWCKILGPRTGDPKHRILTHVSAPGPQKNDPRMLRDRCSPRGHRCSSHLKQIFTILSWRSSAQWRKPPEFRKCTRCVPTGKSLERIHRSGV